jgi:hypothetical protein
MTAKYWVEVDVKGRATVNRWWSETGTTPVNIKDNWVEILANETFDTRRWNGSSWEDVLISLEELRDIRNERLRVSDYTQLNDNPLKGDTSILAYRQALRDITEGYTPVTTPNYPIDPLKLLEREKALALASQVTE